MGSLTTAKQALREVLTRFGRGLARSIPGETEPSLLLDDEHEQYALMRVGWHRDGRRAVYTVFLARIKDGKVWIEEDNTDLTLAEELLKAGVPREDIVLASVHPSERHLTEFAVA